MGFWTQERDDHLLALKAQNISAADIAAQLGDNLTRNAVLGRLHRIGIKSGKLVKKRVMKKHKALVTAYKPPLPFPAVPRTRHVDNSRPRPPRIVCTEADRRLADAPLNLRMMDLEADSCRWPVNDPPPRGEHLFCGHPKRFGSYCAAHAERSVGIGTRSEALADRMSIQRAA